jgi:hypothetical protein
MAKRFETFQQRHARALQAAQDKATERLNQHAKHWDEPCWENADLYLVIETYAHVMGYMGEDHRPTDRKYCEAATAAWHIEIEKNLSLVEILERCIRAGVLAIRKRWPAEAKPKLTAVPKKRRAA